MNDKATIEELITDAVIEYIDEEGFEEEEFFTLQGKFLESGDAFVKFITTNSDDPGDPWALAKLARLVFSTLPKDVVEQIGEAIQEAVAERQ